MQQVVSYTIFLFKQFIISRLVTGQKLRMKDLNQICQNNFRFCRHTLIKRFFTHVTINHPFLFVCFKINITGIFLFQRVIRKFSLIAIHNTPIIGTCRLAVNCFKIEGDSSRLFIVFQKIIGTGIFKQLCEKTPPSYSIPIATPLFSTEYHRAFCHPTGQFLQLVISFLNSGKLLISFIFSSQ